MIFDKYPYSNFHELNDDWLIKTLREFGQRLDEFVAANSLTYADPIEYDPATIYPANTVVIYNDTAYVSKQAVPAGLLPTNGEYWLSIFPFGELIEQGINAGMQQAQDQITAAINTLPTMVNAWMDANPDVTTTVQDGAISWLKLNDNLRAVLLAGYSETSSIPIDDFEQGAIVITTGADTESSFICRTPGFLQFPDGIALIRTMSDFRIQVFQYALDGTFEARVLPLVLTTFQPFIIDANHKYRVSISYENYATLTPADLPLIPVVCSIYQSECAELQSDVSGIKSALHISERTVTQEITTDVTSTWESGYISPSGTITAPHAQYDYSEKIDVVEDDIVTFGENNGMRYICAYDINGAAISAKGSSSITYEYTVPADIVKIVISCSKSNVDHRTIHIRRTVPIEEYYVDGQVNPTTFFVSTTGNNDNDGLSASNPKATINSALESGAETILLFGGVYAQTIDLTKCQHPRIRIAVYEKNKKSVIKAPDAVIADSATQVSGYENVYSAPCDKTFATGNIWIFQDGVNDAATEITAAERHPLQRGYQYRCAETKITKTSATLLADALTEIETSDDYKWFADNGTIYFSCPSAVSSSNPICWSSGTTLFSGASRSVSIEMAGVDVRYLVVNLDNAMSASIENCSSGNVFGDGCFTYDGVAYARFDHCEAFRGFKNTNGDGFNAHGVTTGDTFARQTYGSFVDCWSHDNRDDGVSDHARCESAFIGGLYEYNRLGGGITPSYGSHCTCNGVYCRKNGDGGFLYMDSASVAEGGVGGQLICYNCVAEENTLWPEHTPSGFKINGDNNRATLVNCKSIGQDYGYYITNATSYVKLIDCGTLNCEHPTGGRNDNFTKIVTLIVQ